MSLLEVKNIARSFGGVKALSDVSFSVEQGEIVGLIGPNGAGKTTLFNMITGAFVPDRGEILYRGDNIVSMSSPLISRAGIARTYQNIRLFGPMSVLENVLIGLHAQGSAGLIPSLLRTPSQKKEELRLKEDAHKILRRLGLDRLAPYRSDALSYGQQRKLEIARALASRPSLLLLDEPAAGMGESETDGLMELIRSIREDGVTVLLVEHDMRFVMNLCQKIICINFGVKIVEGTPEVVRNHPKVIEAYLGKDQAVS